MHFSTTSGRGLRETEKNVHTPGSQTKRSSSSDVFPPEMPPLWCGPPCIRECSLLQALGIDRLSLMDVLALSLTAKAAAHSKHSGFIITSSLLPQPDCEPCTSAACPHLGRGRCYDQKLDVTSLIMLALSRHGSGSALWNSNGLHRCPCCDESRGQTHCWRGDCSLSHTQGQCTTLTAHTNTWIKWLLICTRYCYWFCFKYILLGHLCIGFVSIRVALLMLCEPRR